jgi:hypothetical protein
MKYILLFIGLLISNSILSYNPIRFNKNNFQIFKFSKPNELLNYLISFDDFTIITVGEENRKISDDMIKKNLTVYYFDLNNLDDKNDILNYLRKKYKNYDSGEDLWIFHKGFFIGSGLEIYKLLSTRINKKID